MGSEPGCRRVGVEGSRRAARIAARLVGVAIGRAHLMLELVVRDRTAAQLLATAAPHSSSWLPEDYVQHFKQAALGDALLCAQAVPSLPHLSLEPVHQRGWAADYAALAGLRLTS
jgi:hypothetical protein